MSVAGLGGRGGLGGTWRRISMAAPATDPAYASPLLPTLLLLSSLPCSWFYDTKLYWAECSWPCDVPISYGERFVYCLILGFYVQVWGC